MKNKVVNMVAEFLAVTLAFMLGWYFRGISSTEYVYVEVAPNDRVVVDSRLYPASTDTYHGTDLWNPCEVEMYGIDIGHLSDIREMLPEFCKLGGMNYLSLWYTENGEIYVKMQVITLSREGTRALHGHAEELRTILWEKGMLYKYSFEGWDAPDSVSFSPDVPLEEAYITTYGGGYHDPPWYVFNIWFRLYRDVG